MFSQWCQRNKELIAAEARYEESIKEGQRARKEFDASYRALKGASESLPFMNEKLKFSDPIKDRDYLELVRRIFPNRYAAFKELHKKHRLAKYIDTISGYAIFDLKEKLRDARDRMKRWTNDDNGLPPMVRRQQARVWPLDNPINDESDAYP